MLNQVLKDIAFAAKDHFSSNSSVMIAHTGSFCFMICGVEMNMELILIGIGVGFGGLGFLIQWKSARLQKRLTLIELAVKEKELEELSIQQKIYKKEHPEFFENE